MDKLAFEIIIPTDHRREDTSKRRSRVLKLFWVDGHSQAQSKNFQVTLKQEINECQERLVGALEESTVQSPSRGPTFSILPDPTMRVSVSIASI